MKRGATYKESGVDIGRANAFIDAIKPLAAKTHRPGVLRGIGGFGAFFKLPPGKWRRPVFVSSADGVGTKLKCAILAGRYEGLGVDLVAMNVNDILTCGAEPLFFLDYFAVGKVRQGFMKEVVAGIARGCRAAGCALIGGETAEMPGVYGGEDFDLAGFAVGVVEENAIIDGRTVREGDHVIGCASTGFHSNGYSLVRKVFSAAFIRAHAADVLAPTRIYVKPVLALLKRVPVKGMAHITGGGFRDKLTRAIPKGLGAVLDAGSWNEPRVYRWIREQNGASPKELYRTFNMGVGFALIVSPKNAPKALAFLNKRGVESWVIGQIVKGEGVRIQ